MMEYATVSVHDIMIKGHVASALAEKLSMTIDKFVILSIDEDPNRLAYIVGYKVKEDKDENKPKS